jgi:hypothetical protein
VRLNVSLGHFTLESMMSLGTILLIVLVLVLVGVLPTWPHSRSWGYAPSGLVGVVLLVLLVLFLTGRL